MSSQFNDGVSSRLAHCISDMKSDLDFLAEICESYPSIFGEHIADIQEIQEKVEYILEM
jgi:hypothetical protein